MGTDRVRVVACTTHGGLCKRCYLRDWEHGRKTLRSPLPAVLCGCEVPLMDGDECVWCGKLVGLPVLLSA